jgi:2-oxoisovalerate dehydrogenase E1 component
MKARSYVPAVIPTGLGKEDLVQLYRRMFLVRRFEQTVQGLYKKGELPGFIHLYIGEEATAVGVGAHLRCEDWITSTHRGHGHALVKGVATKSVLAELAGKATGCCGGRGGTMHLYAPSVGLFGTNGIVAGGIPSAVGLGISAKTRGTDQVAVAFFGDGAVNHGSFHESVNLAGIQNAPVIFVCENNLYATCTPLTMATRNTNVASKGVAYGVPGVRVDGNDVLAVWQAMKEAVDRARSGGGPTLIESMTYRMVGHHEGDPPVGSYRTQEEIDQWAKQCPLLRFKAILLGDSIATAAELESLEAEVEDEVQEAVEFARSSPKPDPESAFLHTWADPINPSVTISGVERKSQTITQGWLDAVRDGIAEEMRRDSHIIYFGEGIGERGGTFGHTKGLFKEFGAGRVIDTPICELGFTGASIGASASGCRAVADLMISDFLWDAGSQIVLQAARLRYMSNGQVSVPMVVRSGMGTVKNAGPQHSGTYYPSWAHCPGLIVAIPSFPADAKGLMKTALRAGDPVLFFEHKALMSTKGPVPTGEHFVPFGQANVVREGADLTIVSCGLWLHRSLEAAERLNAEGVSCEVIDLRTIVPLDVDTIVKSVAKTGRLLIADEAYSMCGIGAEISAAVVEQAFDELDAPIGRLHTDPVAIPFSPALEDAVVGTVEKIAGAARAVLEGRPLVPRRAKANVVSKTHSTPPEKTESQEADFAKAIRSQPTESTTATNGVPVNMPNMDLIVTEATVVSWAKHVGDKVQKGEILLEIETDKAVTGVESPAEGILAEILAKAGSVVPLGHRLGTIVVDG